MTEAEWVRASAQELRDAVDDLDPRRQRLFGSACCRLLGNLLVPPAPEALDVIERFADTGKTKVALRRARQALRAVRHNLPRAAPGRDVKGFWTLWAVEVAATENASGAAAEEAERALREDAGLFEEVARRWVYGPYRDIAGFLFQPVAFPAAWRTDTAVQLAKGMYESRDFSAMPILADALQDAGCDNDAILEHCRDADQLHVRGCWVVDLVLGKS
jgi:hypothetical protein